MGNRTLAAAFVTACAGTAALLALSFRAPASTADPSQAGPHIADLLESKGGAALDEPTPEVVIAWVFRAEDCLTCQGWSWAFRRIQRRHPTKVKLYGVHVGDDPSAVEKFFRRERLTGSLVHLRPEEARQVFGSTSLPALFVLKGTTVVAVRSYDDRVHDDGGILEAVAELVGAKNEDIIDPS